MASKMILIVCSIAVFVQMAMAQANCGCGNAYLVNGGNTYTGNYGGSSASTYVGNGGGFGVTTYSPITPAGISVRSDNGIEGTLCIDGGLPVYSAIAFEGQLPTSGSAGVQYSCGSNVGISNSAGQGRTGLGNAAGQGVAALGNAARQGGAAWGNAAGQGGVAWGYGAGWGNAAGQASALNGCGCNGY